MATTRSKTTNARRTGATPADAAVVEDSIASADEGTERLVMVGYKTLSAPIVLPEDVIRYGQVVELRGRALEWAKNAVYVDRDGYECDVFVAEDSREGQDAISIAKGERPASSGPRRRPRRR